MVNLISLYTINPTLAFEEFYKLSNYDQVAMIAALHQEALLNPQSDAALLYDDLIYA